MVEIRIDSIIGNGTSRYCLIDKLPDRIYILTGNDLRLEEMLWDIGVILTLITPQLISNFSRVLLQSTV